MYKASIAQQRSIAWQVVQLESTQQAMKNDPAKKWWEQTDDDDPVSSIPTNVKYECQATLGSPKVADCKNAALLFFESGDVTLDPPSGPIIKTAGKLPECDRQK